MRCALVCTALFLAGTVSADGLIPNPRGLMGYTWGMDRESAAKVRASALDCHEVEPLTVCTVRLARPASRDQATVLPAADGTLVLQFNKGRLIGLIHTFQTPEGTLVLAMLHNLMGSPTHRIALSRSSAETGVRLFSWIRPRSVIELEMGDPDNAELPNQRVTVRAWRRSDYLRHHNILPIRTR